MCLIYHLDSFWLKKDALPKKIITLKAKRYILQFIAIRKNSLSFLLQNPLFFSCVRVYTYTTKEPSKLGFVSEILP